MFYVNDEPEGKFLYTETIKLYCITSVYKCYAYIVAFSWSRLPVIFHNACIAKLVLYDSLTVIDFDFVGSLSSS